MLATTDIPTQADRVQAPGATVHTTAGVVRGYRRAGVNVFKGIPYAGAPVGEHRFGRAPALLPWAGVRNAYSYGPVCPSFRTPSDLSSNEWVFLLQRGAESAALEDCLRVNVWTSATQPPVLRPVMLWLHGQGFMSGSSQDFLATEGENLARTQDVVVMSLNHRVGPLGFLQLAEWLGGAYADSGNVGMLDIVDALRWVRDNAIAFGGDPSNVTVFGQSGGGFKVSVLLAMPEAQGLFHKAIIQSGARLRVHTPASAARLAERTLERLGLVRGDARALQAVGVETLLEATQKATLALAEESRDDPGFRDAPPFYWMPVAGVPSLPTQPCDPDAPTVSSHVPVIVGNTLNEFSPAVNAAEAEALVWANVADRMAPQLGTQTAAAIAAARAMDTAARPVDVWSMLAGRRFRQSAVAFCDARARQPGAAPVFNYLFGWRTPVFEGRPGAFHTACLPFVFANTDLCDQATGGGARARALATSMSAAWAEFARSGRPGHADLPSWPAYTSDERALMLFDDPCRIARNFDIPLLTVLPGR